MQNKIIGYVFLFLLRFIGFNVIYNQKLMLGYSFIFGKISKNINVWIYFSAFFGFDLLLFALLEN